MPVYCFTTDMNVQVQCDGCMPAAWADQQHGRCEQHARPAVLELVLMSIILCNPSLTGTGCPHPTMSTEEQLQERLAVCLLC